MSAGKGDTPRPLSVNTEIFKSNWEQTFGNIPEDTRAQISASLDEVVYNCEYSGLPHTASYED
jgi:hypothetical protein